MAELTARSIRGGDTPELGEELPRIRQAWWLRACLPPFIGSLIAGYALCAALGAVVVSFAAGPPPTVARVFSLACSVWLAANHVPLTLDGASLGVLPLLLLVAVGWFAARAAGASAQRIARLAGTATPSVGLTISGLLGCVHAVLGAVFAGLTGTASPVLAFLACLVVGGLSGLIGVRDSCGLVTAAADRLDPVVVSGIRYGLGAAATLFAVGAVLLVAALALNIRTGSALFAVAAPWPGSGIGMLLLCAAYLPNAAIAAGSLAAGPGFTFGGLAITPVDFHAGPLPAVPLLSALPDEFAVWWPFLLVLPIGVGVLTGWAARKSAEHPLRRLRVIAVAALTAAGCWLVLAALAGGTLGHGAFTPVMVPAGAVALAVFCWVAVAGGFTVWFAGPQLPKPERADAIADALGDPADDAPDEPVDVDADGGEVRDEDFGGDEADEADRETLDRETVDHEVLDYEAVDHETVDHEAVDHEAMDYEAADHGIPDRGAESDGVADSEAPGRRRAAAPKTAID